MNASQRLWINELKQDSLYCSLSSPVFSHWYAFHHMTQGFHNQAYQNWLYHKEGFLIKLVFSVHTVYEFGILFFFIEHQLFWQNQTNHSFLKGCYLKPCFHCNSTLQSFDWMTETLYLWETKKCRCKFWKFTLNTNSFSNRNTACVQLVCVVSTGAVRVDSVRVNPQLQQCERLEVLYSRILPQ